eukprot:633363-Rhodomonas_salina.1
MGFFARNLWRKIWEAIAPSFDGNCGIEGDPSECNPAGRISVVDGDGDGIVTVEDIHVALRDLVGLSVDDSEQTLAKFVHRFADTDGSGDVTVSDFETFCAEMPEVYENQKWRLAFPRPKNPVGAQTP